MGGAVEGLAAEPVGRPADGLQQLPFGRELADNVMLGVGAVDGIVGRNGDAVGAAKDAVSPGGYERAIWLKHHHRVLPAGVDVDAAVGIHHGAGAIAQQESLRQFWPSLHHAVAPAAAAQNRSHLNLHHRMQAE